MLEHRYFCIVCSSFSLIVLLQKNSFRKCLGKRNQKRKKGGEAPWKPAQPRLLSPLSSAGRGPVSPPRPNRPAQRAPFSPSLPGARAPPVSAHCSSSTSCLSRFPPPNPPRSCFGRDLPPPYPYKTPKSTPQVPFCILAD